MIEREGLYRALAAHPTQWMDAMPGRTNHLEAGVLVPLVWTPNLCVLMTLRSQNLRDHPGEVCFPGGSREPGDDDLCATALRESLEEIGIDEAQVLGQLSSIPLYTSDFRLVPFAAEVPHRPYRPCSDEVAEVLTVSVAKYLGLHHIDALPFTAHGVTALSPIFNIEGHVVYGATAHVFLELLEIVAREWNWQVPPLQEGRYHWDEILPNHPPPS